MLTKENYQTLSRLTFPVSPDHLKLVLCEANDAEVAAVIRMFVSEVIPFAFRECPLAYEHIRHILGEILCIDPKGVCLTGSSRLGFATPISPSVDKPWGRPLAANSDLDLFVVDSTLFRDCVAEVDLLGEGRVQSRRATQAERLRETERWKVVVDRLRANSLKRGFFDSKYLPIRSQLATRYKIYKAMRAVGRAFKDLPFELIPQGSPTLRVYKNWDAAVGQICFSLRQAARAASNAA